MSMQSQDIQLFKHRRFYDSRGWLANVNQFDFVSSLKTDFCHSFISYSAQNTVRGFHFQIEPLAQQKIVHVLDGVVLDVAFDLSHKCDRPDKFISVLGEQQEYDTIFLSEKMAHGFAVLSEHGATLMYLNSAPYSGTLAKSINPLDPSIECDWRLSEDELIISDRDRSGMSWTDYSKRFL